MSTFVFKLRSKPIEKTLILIQLTFGTGCSLFAIGAMVAGDIGWGIILTALGFGYAIATIARVVRYRRVYSPTNQQQEK